MPYFTQPDPIVNAFAYDGDIDSLPPTDVDPDVANEQTGFPPSQSTPLGAGGFPVNRRQTNGVLSFYTNFTLWSQAGGQYTFESDIADAGGYNAGMILYCASNQSYQVSLIDDNTANFVTTPSYVNDGVNWLQLTNAGANTFSSTVDNASDPYTLTQGNAFQLISNYDGGTSFTLNCPDPNGYTFGFSVCVIFNAGGTLSLTDHAATNVLIDFPASGTVYELWTDQQSWWVNGQLMNYLPPPANTFFTRTQVSGGTYTISISDGGRLIFANTISPTIAFPDPSTLLFGFSVFLQCEIATTVTLTDDVSFTVTINMPVSNNIYKIYTDGQSWYVDGGFCVPPVPTLDIVDPSINIPCLFNSGGTTTLSNTLIQTGSFSDTPTANALTVTFATPFPTACLGVVAGGWAIFGNAPDGGSPIMVELSPPPTTTDFVVKSIVSAGDVDTIEGTYIAIGY